MTRHTYRRRSTTSDRPLAVARPQPRPARPSTWAIVALLVFVVLAAMASAWWLLGAAGAWAAGTVLEQRETPVLRMPGAIDIVAARRAVQSRSVIPIMKLRQQANDLHHWRMAQLFGAWDIALDDVLGLEEVVVYMCMPDEVEYL